MLLLKWGRFGNRQGTHGPRTDHSFRWRRHTPLAAVAGDRAETFLDPARRRDPARQDRRARRCAARRRGTRRHHQPRLLLSDQGPVFGRDRGRVGTRRLPARTLRTQHRAGDRPRRALRGVALRRRRDPACAAVRPSDPRRRRVHRRGRPREGACPSGLDRDFRHRSDASRNRLRLHRMRRAARLGRRIPRRALYRKAAARRCSGIPDRGQLRLELGHVLLSRRRRSSRHSREHAPAMYRGRARACGKRCVRAPTHRCSKSMPRCSPPCRTFRSTTR